MKLPLIAALLALAVLSGCKPQVCVRKGPVDVPDYIWVPQFVNNQMTMSMQWIGSHSEIGCVEWKDAEEKK
jgi:hypothetical protein